MTRAARLSITVRRISTLLAIYNALFVDHALRRSSILIIGGTPLDGLL